MYAAFSKIYSSEEILDAFSVCLKDREDYGNLLRGIVLRRVLEKLRQR